MSDPATTSAKSEITFWAWVVVLAALALFFLTWILNKGIRDIIGAFWGNLGGKQLAAGVGATAAYIGTKAQQSVKIIDDATNEWATDYGFYTSYATTYEPLKAWLLVRSKMIQDFGITFQDATARMPTLTDFENGKLPNLEGLKLVSQKV